MPARLVRPGQRVQLQIHPDPDGDRVSIHALGVDGGGWLATHPRATRRGDLDRSTRRTGTGCPTDIPAPPPPSRRRLRPSSIGSAPLEPLSALLVRRHADLRVAARPLTDYAHLPPTTKENS